MLRVGIGSVVLGASLWAVGGASPTVAAQTATDRKLSCDAFTFLMDRDDFVARFGDAALRDDLINAGGRPIPGTMLFAGTPDHVDLFWNEGRGPRVVTSMTVRTPGTAWASKDGITIGTDLRTVEKINGGPFRLMGFGFDYQGTTMSWADGALAAQEQERCRLRLRLRPDDATADPDVLAQVSGTREYTSSHPAMQDLNPKVYEMWLEFGRFGG